MNDYDSLNLCAECGDAYTTGTLCHNCARQHAIDNDPMTEYDAIHYDPVYGYDDDDDDGRGDYDYGGDYETWQGDNIYADDETIDLSPSWRWKWYKFKSKMRYLWDWKLSHPVHTLRMKYDKRYRDSYWNDVIPY